MRALERSPDARFANIREFAEALESAPRAETPHVTWDFWGQFDAAQDLEELRLFRPAIYKALPEAGLKAGTTSDDARR